LFCGFVFFFFFFFLLTLLGIAAKPHWKKSYLWKRPTLRLLLLRKERGKKEEWRALRPLLFWKKGAFGWMHKEEGGGVPPCFQKKTSTDQTGAMGDYG